MTGKEMKCQKMNLHMAARSKILCGGVGVGGWGAFWEEFVQKAKGYH